MLNTVCFDGNANYYNGFYLNGAQEFGQPVVNGQEHIEEMEQAETNGQERFDPLEVLIHKTRNLGLNLPLFNNTSNANLLLDEEFEYSDHCRALRKRIFAQDDVGNFTILNRGEWKKILPDIYNLEEWEFENLVLDTGEVSLGIWHNQNIINDSIKLFEYLLNYNPEPLSKILAMDFEGKYPLENPLICRYLTPVLAGPSLASLPADRERLYDLLLQDADCLLEAMIPVLKKIDLTNLNILFNMHDQEILKLWGDDRDKIDDLFDESLRQKKLAQNY